MSPNQAGFDLRETSPLPRNILPSPEIGARAETGQRTNSRNDSKSYRGRALIYTVPKDVTGYLNYPVAVRDSAESGLGRIGNRHLPSLAESILVNVGSSRQDVKVSSLPMLAMSGGGVVVLRAWESHVHGKGRQEANVAAVLMSGIKPEGRSS